MNKPKRVLVITYYWPPSGGSGVQRWLKFVKYFRDFGIEPIVYCPENASYPIEDSTLLSEVPEGVEILTHPIKEPNSILKIFKKKKAKKSAGFLDSNPGLIGRTMLYVRGNYFIPDARMLWIKPSVKFLSKEIPNLKIDAVISTGPPHSMHLIALNLKKKLGIPWLADFRDPWTEIDYFHQLPLTEKSKSKHRKFELDVLNNADDVVVIGKTMMDQYKEHCESIGVITNGFDTDIAESSDSTIDKDFSITHIGLMNADRNPHMLWMAIKELSKEIDEFSKDVKIKLVGAVADEVNTSLMGLEGVKVERIDYLPHKEVREYQRKSQVLLLAVNKVPSAKGIITGKIFEYLQAKRPILAIGPTDGDLSEILNLTNAGKICDFDDLDAVKRYLLEYYNLYKQSKLNSESHSIEQYHRRSLTRVMADRIKRIIS